MKATRSGPLRQRFTLQKPQTPEQFDSFGQPVPNYTTIGTYWGALEPLQGREAVIAKQIYATATHKITLRWLGPDVEVNPLDRLTRTEYSVTRTFGVIAVNDVETRHRRYEAIVEEIQIIEVL